MSKNTLAKNMLKIVFDSNIYLAAMGMRSFCFDLVVEIATRPLDYPLFISEPIIKEVEKNAKRLVGGKIAGEQLKNRIIWFAKTVPNIIYPEEKILFLKHNPKDNKILECAVAAEADLIITMDKDLLKLKNFQNIGIIHPITFTYSMSKI